MENNPESATALSTGSEAVAYHSHCQQRTLGLEAYTTAVLEELDYDVLTSSVECCGMAGSFSYKTQYYDLSIDVGTELVEQFLEPNARERVILTSGTSCTDQLDDLLDRDPMHPIELIAPKRPTPNCSLTEEVTTRASVALTKTGWSDNLIIITPDIMDRMNSRKYTFELEEIVRRTDRIRCSFDVPLPCELALNHRYESVTGHLYTKV